MWLVYWADHLFQFDFYKLGVKPKDFTALKGVVAMPLVHAKMEVQHIFNNSIPTFVLLAALIYFYRSIALKVFALAWVFTGLGLWIFATNTGAFHIGMSGVIYALAAFLFTSGIIRKYLPLQGIALFVSFVYGSLIWGIFPMETHVSWEGHLSGLLTGILLAILYRKEGPQRPMFQYEIEKEMGIEPPDLEGIWNAQQEEARRIKEERENADAGFNIIYHYKPSSKKDETDEK